jgi:hypothetical protein
MSQSTPIQWTDDTVNPVMGCNAPCELRPGPGEVRELIRTFLYEEFPNASLSLAKHRALMLNYFIARKEYSSGVVEGLNNKLKLTLKRSYDLRTDLARKVALYHTLAHLPEPPLTHSFF